MGPTSELTCLVLVSKVFTEQFYAKLLNSKLTEINILRLQFYLR